MDGPSQRFSADYLAHLDDYGGPRSRFKNNPIARLGASNDDVHFSGKGPLTQLLFKLIPEVAGLYNSMNGGIYASDYLIEDQEVYDDVMLHELMHPAMQEIQGGTRVYGDPDHGVIYSVMANDPESSLLTLANTISKLEKYRTDPVPVLKDRAFSTRRALELLGEEKFLDYMVPRPRAVPD